MENPWVGKDFFGGRAYIRWIRAGLLGGDTPWRISTRAAETAPIPEKVISTAVPMGCDAADPWFGKGFSGGAGVYQGKSGRLAVLRRASG